MRIYQPAGTVETLQRLLAEPRIQDALVEHRVIPEREAQVAPFPEWLDKRLVRGLHAQGIEMLYTHQRDALDALRDGKDVVVVTPTASGKTLCYGLPVLQAVADDPAARALFLFPTKALSQDQLAAFRELTEKSDMEVQAGVYDGDTPGPIRTNIRTSGQGVWNGVAERTDHPGRATFVLVTLPDCPADFDHSGEVTSADLFAFLTAFFSDDPAADVNDDGIVNSADFFVFLPLFFEGCE